MDIYLQKDGQKQGPFSENRIRQGIDAGEFASADLAWMKGNASWQPLSSLIGLDVNQPPPIHDHSLEANFHDAPVDDVLINAKEHISDATHEAANEEPKVSSELPPKLPGPQSTRQQPSNGMLRDAAIVVGMAMIGGLISVGLWTTGQHSVTGTSFIIGTSFALMTAVFVSLGLDRPTAKLKYSLCVALGCWLMGLFIFVKYYASEDTSDTWIIWGLILLMLIALIGFGVSKPFAHQKPVAAADDAIKRKPSDGNFDSMFWWLPIALICLFGIYRCSQQYIPKKSGFWDNIEKYNAKAMGETTKPDNSPKMHYVGLRQAKADFIAIYGEPVLVETAFEPPATETMQFNHLDLEYIVSFWNNAAHRVRVVRIDGKRLSEEDIRTVLSTYSDGKQWSRVEAKEQAVTDRWKQPAAEAFLMELYSDTYNSSGFRPANTLHISTSEFIEERLLAGKE